MNFVGSEYQKQFKRADELLFDLREYLLGAGMQCAASSIFLARLKLADAENNVRGLLQTQTENDARKKGT